MYAIDFEILVEWHAGSEDLWPIDKMQFSGITLEGLLALPGHFRRKWLLFIQQARLAKELVEDVDEVEPD
jgi:hypothetical protein